ncbi:MAG TPA: hypothetical protein DDE71_01115 [Tenacibaculum sp.]|nr:hypothetical protein [Tenacibaculum sp.]
MLKSALKATKPLLKKSAKRLGKAALNTGTSVLGDVLEGKNLKASIKKRSGNEFEKLKNDGINSIQSVLRPPVRNPKKSKNPIKTRKSHKKRSDNFGKY